MPRGWTCGPAQPKSIPAPIQVSVRQRIEAHAAENFAGRYARLDIRFRGRFCYVDAFKEPDKKHHPKPGWFEGAAEQLRETPVHLIRQAHKDDVVKCAGHFFKFTMAF
jgi:hypothetical protein